MSPQQSRDPSGFFSGVNVSESFTASDLQRKGTADHSTRDMPQTPLDYQLNESSTGGTTEEAQ